MRALLVRRLLCTSFFSSQSRPSSAAIAAASANLNTDQPAAEPSTTLFVHGLNKRTTPETLHEAFSRFGEVVTANIITDRASGFSKGYGFVGYATLDDAEKGMKGMNAESIDGWVIFAEYAKPKRY